MRVHPDKDGLVVDLANKNVNKIVEETNKVDISDDDMELIGIYSSDEASAKAKSMIGILQLMWSWQNLWGVKLKGELWTRCIYRNSPW